MKRGRDTEGETETDRQTDRQTDTHTHTTHTHTHTPAEDPEGGGGVPVKTSHKKMAAIRGALYFMSLAPPPTILDPML